MEEKASMEENDNLIIHIYLYKLSTLHAFEPIQWIIVLKANDGRKIYFRLCINVHKEELANIVGCFKHNYLSLERIIILP